MLTALVVAGTLCGNSPVPPQAEKASPAFSVNVFPSASAGDWEQLHDPSAPSRDLRILITAITGDDVAVTVRYGMDDVLSAHFSRERGPDLNVFDYSTRNITKVTSEAARCPLGSRTIECTLMRFESSGTFVEAGETTTKPMRASVWLAPEVKGAGVVSVELQVGREPPTKHSLVGYGTRGTVLWSAPGKEVSAP